jgi:hypothetical protein
MRGNMESDPIVQTLSTLEETGQEPTECDTFEVVNAEMNLGHW